MKEGFLIVRSSPIRVEDHLLKFFSSYNKLNWIYLKAFLPLQTCQLVIMYSLYLSYLNAYMKCHHQICILLASSYLLEKVECII